MADRLSKLDFTEADSFQWDERKNELNITKHGIDFEDAIKIFDDAILLSSSSRNNEERWVAIGKSNDRIIAAILTQRGKIIRIISTRLARKMKKQRTVTRQVSDRRKGKTDWSRVDKLTDQNFDAAIADGDDWAEFKNIDWSKATLVIPAKKKAISIRIDEDVLDYFKNDGEGYQGRMNAVLRSYMQQTAKPKKSD